MAASDWLLDDYFEPASKTDDNKSQVQDGRLAGPEHEVLSPVKEHVSSELAGDPGHDGDRHVSQPAVQQKVLIMCIQVVDAVAGRPGEPESPESESHCSPVAAGEHSGDQKRPYSESFLRSLTVESDADDTMADEDAASRSSTEGGSEEDTEYSPIRQTKQLKVASKRGRKLNVVLSRLQRKQKKTRAKPSRERSLGSARKRGTGGVLHQTEPSDTEDVRHTGVTVQCSADGLRRKRGRPKKTNFLRVIWDPDKTDSAGAVAPADEAPRAEASPDRRRTEPDEPSQSKQVTNDKSLEQHSLGLTKDYIVNVEAYDGGEVSAPSPELRLKTNPKGATSNFLCCECGMVFDRPWKLELHTAKTHREGHAGKDKVCQLCNESFYTDHELKRHNGRFHCEREQCEICGKLVKKSAIWEHKNFYHGDPKFLCRQCGFKATRWHHLQRHVEGVHQKLRKHTCPHEGCSSTFTCKSALQKHIEVRHDEIRKYECSWAGCSKAFGRRYHLNRHVLTHTGEKPVSCSLCDYTCRQKTSLDFHMKKKHAHVFDCSDVVAENPHPATTYNPNFGLFVDPYNASYMQQQTVNQ